MATLAYRADQNAFALEFDPAFVGEGHDLSPLNLPLQVYGRGVHIFQGSDTPFAGGLPGLIADSLPDAWGEKLLRQEMPEIRTIMGKLAAVGRRGPGAITFEPPLGSGTDTTGTLTDLSALVRAADALRTSPVPLNADLINRALARGGSSLGGAYPKISSHLPFGMESLDKKEVLIGGTTPSGHSPCVLKFERVGDEADGAVEFAFSLMAKAAGLRVPQTCLVNDGARRHFACARFDRYQRPDGSWGRHHVHTLSGMLHRRASDGAIDYEEFIRLTRNLCGAGEATECFRRAVFNLLSTNRDDHGRNHAFLYDERHRKWSLSPAYDLNPNVANVLIGLSWLGGAQIPEKFDKIMRLAEIGGISPSKARTIYDQVEEAVIAGWPRFAAKAGVPLPMIEYWQREMMVQTAALRKDAEHKPHRA
jgi:serine/threonine-protein kinase HipA